MLKQSQRVRALKTRHSVHNRNVCGGKRSTNHLARVVRAARRTFQESTDPIPYLIYPYCNLAARVDHNSIMGETFEQRLNVALGPSRIVSRLHRSDRLEITIR